MATGAKIGEWYLDKDSYDYILTNMPLPIKTPDTEVWWAIEVLASSKGGNLENIAATVEDEFRDPKNWDMNRLTRLPDEWKKQVMDHFGGWRGLKNMLVQWMFDDKVKAKYSG